MTSKTKLKKMGLFKSTKKGLNDIQASNYNFFFLILYPPRNSQQLLSASLR